jgi:hypothetical protein
MAILACRDSIDIVRCQDRGKYSAMVAAFSGPVRADHIGYKSCQALCSHQQPRHRRAPIANTVPRYYFFIALAPPFPVALLAFSWSYATLISTRRFGLLHCSCSYFVEPLSVGHLILCSRLPAPSHSMESFGFPINSFSTAATADARNSESF